MPEQVLKSPASGAGMEITGAGSANYPILAGGKVAPASGKALPKITPQKVDLQYLVGKLNIASQTIGRDGELLHRRRDIVLSRRCRLAVRWFRTYAGPHPRS